MTAQEVTGKGCWKKQKHLNSRGGILNERTKNINYFKRASWFEKL